MRKRSTIHTERNGDTLFSIFKQLLGRYLNLDSIIKEIIPRTHDAISELQQLDTSLTEISLENLILTAKDLKQLSDIAFETAGKYGKTAAAYLADFTEMSRAGYQNAESMASLSAAAQTAGNLTAELANRYITAADQAYRMNGSITELTQTLDGANNIAGRNALDMTELARGVSAVAGQAASSRMEIDETTAAIGTLIAVTNEGGTEMGNAFSAILMNLRQVTGIAADGGDMIDTDSLTRYKDACAGLGVSLSELKNGVMTLKEPMQILKELSAQYNELSQSDTRRNNLLQSVGGENRAEALNALLENYSLYEKMMQDYTNGSGTMSALAEQAAGSWENSLNRLSNTWTQTVGNIVESDAAAVAVNGLNGILSAVNKLTGALGSLGTIGVGAGLYAGLNNIGKCRISVRIS